jgi:16S rRNA (cytidine1402-2'-O)-methyltransferase
VADHNKKGILYLIPVLLGDTDVSDVLPEKTIAIANEIVCFIAENAKSARKFLKQTNSTINLQEVTVLEIDKHSSNTDFNFYFEFLRKGINTGLLSEAGMPAVADPGAVFTRQAHKENIKVIPLTGPSSIILALAASGLNGQGFTFHGYLPKEKADRIEKLKSLELAAKRNHFTQIFIETPYRNNQVIEDILKTCGPSVLLCIAASISTMEEKIVTKSVQEWKANVPDLNKTPTVFLLL